MISLTLATLTLLQTATSQEAQASEHEKRWTAYLRSLVKDEQTQLVFDFTPMPVPDQPEEHLGLFGLDVLARRANRVRIEIDGVQVFARKQPTGSREINSNAMQLLALLSSLDADTLRRLCTDGMKLSELPVSQMRDVLLSLPLSPADCVRAAKGENLKIALDLFADFTFKVKDTGEVKSGKLYTDRFGRWISEASKAGAENASTIPTALVQAPPKPPDDGELDFGEGSILKLDDVIKKAALAFGKRYFCDSRLSESKYFFSGKFTVERFEKTMKELCRVIPLTEAVPPEAVPSYLDYARDIRKAFADNPAVYSREGLLATMQPNLSSSTLAAASLPFAQMLKQWNLDGSEFQVSLSPELALAVFMPGSEAGGQVAFRLEIGKLGN